MKREFKIYKQGITTAGKRTILSSTSIPFNRTEKIKKYLILGYKVYDLNDKEIKTI